MSDGMACEGLEYGIWIMECELWSKGIKTWSFPGHSAMGDVDFGLGLDDLNQMHNIAKAHELY